MGRIQDEERASERTSGFGAPQNKSLGYSLQLPELSSDPEFQPSLLQPNLLCETKTAAVSLDSEVSRS